MNLEPIIEKALGVPTEKQEEFCRATSRYVGYGGAKGGGKSHAVRLKATLLAYEHPGIKILIIRRTLQELRENHTNRLIVAYNMLPPEVKPKYNNDEKAFLFPNGSRIKLGYCDTDADALQYQGQEYDVIFVDEATQIYEEWFAWIDACVRGVNKYPKRTYLTCNPGGVGHGWVARLFVFKKYRKRERPKDYTFIKALIWDNQPLFDEDLDYLAEKERLKKEHKLKKLTPELELKAKEEAQPVRDLYNKSDKLRKAWLEGDWTVFEGQYFTEWDEDVHIIDPIPLKPWWRKSIAIDYGLDTLAVVWVAIDENGKCYVYRNIEKVGLAVEAAVAEIRRETNEQIDCVYAPPDIFGRTTDKGIKTSDQFALNGMPLIKTSNEREAGWLRVKDYLKTEDGYGKKDGYPVMKVFKTCIPLITNLPLLQYDTKKVNDVATEPHELTHSPDALRYWCSMYQLGTKEPEEIKPDPFNLRKPKRMKASGYLLGGY